jgi:hypothetical protein
LYEMKKYKTEKKRKDDATLMAASKEGRKCRC